MKKLFMALIRFYQKWISPLKPPCCRFTPTCSAYAMEAFEKRGCMAGCILMIWRILRCSPLSPAGHDPVPEKGFRTMPMRWSTFRKSQNEPPKIPLETEDGTLNNTQDHLNAEDKQETQIKDSTDESDKL